MKRMKAWKGWCRVYSDGLTGKVHHLKADAHIGLMPDVRIARVRVTEVVKPKRRKPR